jgi:hypothetical protein
MRPALCEFLAIALVVAPAGGCSRQGRGDAPPRVPRKVIDLSTTITPDLAARTWGTRR